MLLGEGLVQWFLVQTLAADARRRSAVGGGGRSDVVQQPLDLLLTVAILRFHDVLFSFCRDRPWAWSGLDVVAPQALADGLASNLAPTAAPSPAGRTSRAAAAGPATAAGTAALGDGHMHQLVAVPDLVQKRLFVARALGAWRSSASARRRQVSARRSGARRARSARSMARMKL